MLQPTSSQGTRPQSFPTQHTTQQIPQRVEQIHSTLSSAQTANSNENFFSKTARKTKELFQRFCQSIQRCWQRFLQCFRREATAPTPTPQPVVTPTPTPPAPPAPPSPIQQACAQNNIEAVRALIGQGTLVSGNEFLAACANSNEDILCEITAATNPPNLLQSFPLGQIALDTACQRQFPRLLDALLQRGAPEELRDGALNALFQIEGENRYDQNPVTWQMMIRLLEAGANLRAQDQNGDFIWNASHRVNQNNADVHPLSIAFERNDQHAINLLRQRGAPILHYLSETPNRDLIRAYIQQGMDVNDEFNGWTPLQVAVESGQLENIQELLALGARTEVYNPEGYTPLHLACFRGDLNCVQLLVENRVNPLNVNIQQNRGMQTPLHVAVTQGHVEVARYLLDRGALVNALDNPRVQYLGEGGIIELDEPTRPAVTPLSLALEAPQNREQIIPLLLQRGATLTPQMNWTLTQEKVQQLQAAGANFQEISVNGNNLLHTFIANTAGREIDDRLNETLIALLNAGVPMDQQNAIGAYTAFARACSYAQHRFIETMINRRNAPINIPNAHHITPLELLLRNENATVETVQRLIQAGANVNVGRPGQNFSAPFTTACENARDLRVIRTLLFDHNANINPNAEGLTPLHALATNTHIHGNAIDEVIAELVRRGNDINARIQNVVTPMMMAYVHGSLEKVEAFQRAGADGQIDPNLRINGLTLLHGLMQTPIQRVLGEAELEARRVIFNRMIQAGIDPNAQDGLGNTALMNACRNGRISDIENLLALPNPPVNLANNAGETPLAIACRNARDPNIIRILLAHGAQTSDAIIENALGELCRNIIIERRPRSDYPLDRAVGDLIERVQDPVARNEMIERLLQVATFQGNQPMIAALRARNNP